ncbi:MAG TPA: polyketide synthase dehydratase domain-containing protein [Kiritimatiellia bacterium]|nr:polyketide synthase dehydratase domain-containing protein [Kiritimatiellia bacterium]
MKWPVELILICAPTREALAARCGELVSVLEAQPGLRLVDVAAALASAWKASEPTLGLIAKDVPDLIRRLRSAVEKLSEPGRDKLQTKSGIFYFQNRLADEGRVAFIFPGEGAQYLRMLEDVCMAFPEVRTAFEQVDAACLSAEGGVAPSQSIFPPAGEGDDHREAIFSMEVAVESVSAANLGLYRLFQRLGIVPDAVVGHSSGEFIALDAAGVVRLDETSRHAFIREGYLGVQRLVSRTDIPEGILITVGGAARAAIDTEVGRSSGRVVIAMDNCPHQAVLCCGPEVVDGVMARLASQGGIVSRLEFNRPYHTPWFAPALDGIRALFQGAGLHPPQVETWSCLSADRFPADPKRIEELAVGQWAAPVLFQDTVRAMYGAGCRIFVEVGPRGNLTAFVNDILSGKSFLAVAANRMHKSGLEHLCMTLAMLAAHGVPMKPEALFTHRKIRPVNLATGSKGAKARPTHHFPPFTPKLRGVGLPVREAAPRPATVPMAISSFAEDVPSLSLPGSDAERVLHAYFETMELFVESQNDLARMLMSPPSGAPPATSAVSSGRRAPAGSSPMIVSCSAVQPGRSLVAHCRFDVAHHVFLRDHALGCGKVSVGDPELTGIIVMPLTMSLTTLSEAARLLFPGHVVTGLKEIRANKWVSFHKRVREVTVQAEVRSMGEVIEVHCAMREADTNDPRIGFKSPLNEAVILLAKQYPEAPRSPDFALASPRPCLWRGSEIYPDRLFHGPMFQGITEINGWGENGVTGKVEVLDRAELIAGDRDPEFGMDGVFLDTVGGTLGLWGAYDRYDGYVYLPFRIQGVQFYQPLLPAGSSYDLTLHVVRRSEMSAAADIYAFDGNRRVVCGIQGWEDRDFYVTPALHRITHEPLRYDFCEDVAGAPPATCITPELPRDFFTSGHRVWEQVLTMILFGREERAEWSRKTGNDAEKAAYVLIRAAAKGAVRRLLATRHGIQVGAADIRIEPGPGGFVATGFWQGSAGGKAVAVRVEAKGARYQAKVIE